MPSTVFPHGWGPGWRQAPSPWPGLEYRKPVLPPSFPHHSCTPLFSPFLFSLRSWLHLLFAPPSLPTPKGVPIHQGKIRALSSPRLRASCTSQESRGPGTNSGGQSPSPLAPEGTPLYPWSKPDTFLPLFHQGNPSSQGWVCLLHAHPGGCRETPVHCGWGAVDTTGREPVTTGRSWYQLGAV